MELIFINLNYLVIPERHFGTDGINTANLIFHAVKSINPKAIIQYKCNKKVIVIKNLGEFTIKGLEKVLYSKKLAPRYKKWYPKVEKKDLDETFLIKLSSDFPKKEPSVQSDRSDSDDVLEMYSEKLKEEKISEVIKSKLSNAAISALTIIMNNPKEEFSGVWYPDDLKEFFLKKSEEMPEDYWSGYASSDYFNRTGFFTFELKDGKSASEAINVLIAGPSVLDCGNATQLAYYKAILDVIGSEKFDTLFSSKILRLKITQNGITDSEAPIYYFSDYTFASKKNFSAGEIGKRPLNIGETCYFQGIKFYTIKHPAGFSNGWNVIYVGNNESEEQLFIAHGFELPMTEKEINKLLVELYNEKRTAEDERYIAKYTAKYTAEYPDLKKMYDRNANYTVPIELKDEKVEGFLIESCQKLKSDIIARAFEVEVAKVFKEVIKEF